jgi:hypothetical protein
LTATAWVWTTIAAAAVPDADTLTMRDAAGPGRYPSSSDACDGIPVARRRAAIVRQANAAASRIMELLPALSLTESRKEEASSPDAVAVSSSRAGRSRGSMRPRESQLDDNREDGHAPGNRR